MRELLGDYEPRGKVVQGLGKFIAFGLDDPFHVTTATGLALYGIGKIMERRSNYGLRRAKIDIAFTTLEIKEIISDLAQMRLM
ncbi:MAG: hypothetical protein QXY37_02080 [Metallosphaera sp.]|uniref:hypothetical protein n=1 Tax=Metallosphaera sp. TaxID=2020860 RepID=UPI00315E50A5